MPVYDYKCGKCEKEDLNRVEPYENKVLKCKCGGDKTRFFTSMNSFGDLEPYMDQHIGEHPTYIKSKKHRQQVMKENGVVEKLGKNWNTSFV